MKSHQHVGEHPGEPALEGEPWAAGDREPANGKGQVETGWWEAQCGVVVQETREGSISLWEEDLCTWTRSG